MKKIDILSMNEVGVFVITANTLDAKSAYTVLKFKREGKKAFDAILEAEKAIREEVGIADALSFDMERETLMKSQDNPERLDELNGIIGIDLPECAVFQKILTAAILLGHHLSNLALAFRNDRFTGCRFGARIFRCTLSIFCICCSFGCV